MESVALTAAMEDDQDVGLVDLLQSVDASSQGMDPEVMELMPSEDEPGHVGPIYGPHLPGLEAGNSLETAPNNSPVPTSFMEYDNPAPTLLTDIKDPTVHPGQSGLQNMGNTCFMNSVLQCLMHNSYLCHSLLGGSSYPPDSLTGQFVALLTKIWEGQYAVVHPAEFKEKLGLVHDQFKDFRQHDGQEFLALLLDTLHQELNWNARQRKVASPATDLSEESDDSHYASEASSSKLSELEALDLDSVKDEPVNNHGAGSSDSEASTSAVDNPPRCSPTEGGSKEGGLKDPVRLPSIEEFYKKDVKTLNTNMLQENEVSVSLSTGSDKFPRKKKSSLKHQDRLKGRTENSFQKSPIKNKKTNLIAARKSRSQMSKSLLCGSGERDAKVNECTSSTDDQEGAKRIKLAPEERGGYAATDKPSNVVVSANFHDYVASGGESPEAGVEMDLGYDPDSDHLGLETLSRRLNQELEGAGIGVRGCDSSVVKNSKSFQRKSDEDISSRLADLPSSTTNAKGSLPTLGTVGGEVLRVADSGKRVNEFVPNNKEHLTSLQLEKPLSRIEKNNESERQWEGYLRSNESVIVNNFHGQLKSTVVCQGCHHVSIIYEPFVYLSVPLPRAMEKQFVVTFVRSGGQTPIRYAIVLNKTDTVTELRRTLLYTFYGEISGREIVLAEALDCHISRILEDGIQLQYVNSGFRLIYAFEIDYKPCVTVATSNFSNQATACSSDQAVISSTSDFANTLSSLPFDNNGLGFRENNWELLSSEVSTSNVRVQAAASTLRASESVVTEPDSTVRIEQGGPGEDIFSNMGAFRLDNPDGGMSGLVGPSGENRPRDDTGGWMPQGDTTGADMDQIGTSSLGLEGQGGVKSTESVSKDVGTNTSESDGAGGPLVGVSSTDYKDVDGHASTSTYTQTDGGPATPTEGEVALTIGSSMPANDNDDMQTEVGDRGDVSDVRGELPAEGGCGEWHICIICLEELSADQLLTHPICQGKLCQLCVNRTKTHYGHESIACPVCRADMNPETDFVPLVPNSGPLQPIIRVLLLPVQFRNEWVENGERKMTLFGHPNVLFVMSRISGEELFSQLKNIAPVSAEFTVALTDAQGLHCSRCPYDLHCSGCHLAQEVDIDLLSDDHLTVSFYDLSLQGMDEASRSLDHETIEHLQSDVPITLYDCFRAFTASEELDECNPWFCPECKKHQRAMKTMAIQKFPNTLIVYLKRFVFHQFMSTKLDNMVQFPVTDLSFSELMGGDCSLVYNLQSAVCHFGGVNSGHYTSYVKNPICGSWQYCNDETITERVPAEEDAENVYILFYQRKDTDLPFTLPRSIKMADEAPPPSPCKGAGDTDSPAADDQYGYSNSDDINKLVASLVQGEPPLAGAGPIKVKDQSITNGLGARLHELD